MQGKATDLLSQRVTPICHELQVRAYTGLPKLCSAKHDSAEPLTKHQREEA